MPTEYKTRPIPDGGLAKYPSTMSDAEIDKIHASRFGATPAPSPTPAAAPTLDPGTPTDPNRDAAAKIMQGAPAVTKQMADVGTAAARYGLPTAMGLANPSMAPAVLLRQALVSGASEFTARHLERVAEDPTFQTRFSDLEAAGWATGIDLGISAATKGTGAVFRYFGRKLLLPTELPVEVRLAQETLGELSERAPAARRFLEWSSLEERPFSLTFGQINAAEKSFINWLEGVAEASITGRGRMKRFNVRNQEAVTDAIEKFVTDHTRGMTGSEFAVFAKQLIGKGMDEGQMFTPIRALQKYLYVTYENALKESNRLIDGTRLRTHFLDATGEEKQYLQRAYNELRDLGFLPPLQTVAPPPSTVTKRVTTSTTEGIDEVSDLKKTNLLTGKEKRVAERVEGQKGGTRTKETVQRTETIKGGPSEEDIAAMWRELPAIDVERTIRHINSYWQDPANVLDESARSTAKYVNGVYKRLRERIAPELQAAIKDAEAFRSVTTDVNGNQVISVTTVEDLQKAAREWHGAAKENVLKNAALNAFRQQLKDKPAAVLKLVGGTSGSDLAAREVYDNLLGVKQGLEFSAEAIERGAGKVTRPLDESFMPSSRAALEEMYDSTILQPIRYWMITKHVDQYGKINPQGFLSMLHKNADTPEFFEEVFGGAANVEHVKNLMTTLAVLQKAPAEKNIMIQLAQASALAGLAGGATYMFSDDPSIGKSALAGGAAIFIAPYALSRVLTDAQLVRNLTDGVAEGVRSSKLGVTLRKIAGQKYASTFAREHNSEEAVNFYTSNPSVGAPPDARDAGM